MPEQSTECWEALKAILPSGDHCVLFLEEPADPGRGLKLVTQFPIEQMLCESPRTLSSTDVEIEELGEDDVHEMMSLASLTEPGPFRCRTIQLGGYIGIREGGLLAAMAGQRTAIPGCREVSAVCTHPSYRGRGYATTLVRAVMDGGREARRASVSSRTARQHQCHPPLPPSWIPNHPHAPLRDPDDFGG